MIEFSAVEIAAAVTAGELRTTEIAEATLARAAELGPVVGAFTFLAPERTLEQATNLDRRRAAGDPLPLLAGVPCPIKDLASVAGLPFEGGSAAWRGNLGVQDDSIVTRLAEAGTLLIGKTSTPEFGLPCYTEPENQEPARTPYDLRRSAGGSSGGAAAAVAAGIVPIAHGSDGGGSIRIPASVCGLVGLKASRGLISPGKTGVAGPALATDGVLAKTVADTAFALDALTGNWDGDTFFARHQESLLAASRREPKSLRVGLLTEPVIAADAEVAPECVAAATTTAHQLEALGHRVEAAPVPFPAERWAAFTALWSVLALQVPVPNEDALRPLTRWLRDQGRKVTGLEYATSVAAVQRLTQEVAKSWSDFDVIVSPTLARPPVFVGELRHDEDPAQDFADQTRYTPWTSIYNLTGRPALSLPLGWTESTGHRLPLGVMLGGRVGADGLLLALGRQLGC